MPGRKLTIELNEVIVKPINRKDEAPVLRRLRINLV